MIKEHYTENEQKRNYEENQGFVARFLELFSKPIYIVLLAVLAFFGMLSTVEGVSYYVFPMILLFSFAYYTEEGNWKTLAEYVFYFVIMWWVPALVLILVKSILKMKTHWIFVSFAITSTIIASISLLFNVPNLLETIQELGWQHLVFGLLLMMAIRLPKQRGVVVEEGIEIEKKNGKKKNNRKKKQQKENTVVVTKTKPVKNEKKSINEPVIVNSTKDNGVKEDKNKPNTNLGHFQRTRKIIEGYVKND